MPIATLPRSQAMPNRPKKTNGANIADRNGTTSRLGSEFRCELGELVNTKALFDSSNFVHHFFKTVLTKKLVLFFLEIFAQ